MAESTKNHDFSAFSGKSGQSGLPPEEERLARICRSPRRNPYCFGTALQAGSPVFIGRKREIHEISASLRRAKPANISLLGERRGGKSSLLRQIVKNLENEEGLVVILGDAQHWSQNSREHFFANLHAAICKALDDDSGPVNRYDDFHAFIQRRAKHYRFVLIIDEFEEMAVNPEFDADFFTCLRALGNDDRCNFGYLLASRLSLEKICNDTDKVSSLFWNIFYTYTLGLLSRQEAVTLIHKPFHRSLGLRLADEEVKKIYRYTGCHPAFIQMFMDKIWISKDGGYNPDWEQLEFNLRSHYGALWEQRSPAETALLILLAAGKTPNRDFAFSELRQRGLIDKNGQNFSVFFKLLIPAWLPPGKDLQSVLGEIEQGVDKGSRFFDTFLKMAEMAGKVRKAFVSGGEDEHG